MIAENLVRSKIECVLYVEKLSVAKFFDIDKNIVRSYMDDLKAIIPGFEEIDYLKLAMRLPDVLSNTQIEIATYKWQ
ncbi:MAG: hypothetical protein ACMUEL_02020 [Flavobacteriales bacterium Tduv]